MLSKTPSGKYLASILTEVEGKHPTATEGKIYKLERNGGKLVEIDRWFPSSKLCSNCFYQMSEMPLDVREWTCPHCNIHHDRDVNAAVNVKLAGQNLLPGRLHIKVAGGHSETKKGRGGKHQTIVKVAASCEASTRQEFIQLSLFD